MDLREGLNAVSDVMMNRPPPLREFDQIYMKAADMLIQAEHVARWLDKKEVVFVGDGDAIALLLVHLVGQGIIEQGPKTMHVLDFDERIVNAVRRFAERHGYEERLWSSRYNVLEPLPEQHRGHYDAFYTNPPFGGSNKGASVTAFLTRGIEAIRDGGLCCAAVADYEELPWCDEVLHVAQKQLLSAGFVVAEMVPRFHRYHLDDEPDLTSCSLIARHVRSLAALPTSSSKLDDEVLKNFYGRGARLDVAYVEDLRNGGKMAGFDHKLVPLAGEGKGG
jgi:predicted methyltransferase